MAQIVGACLARNEAAPDRYLDVALRNALSLCDRVLLLDDGSTDSTATLAQTLGAEVVTRESAGMWGTDESSARQQLWELASQRGDWIYIFDADHELLGITKEELHLLCEASSVDAWACPLWDCWDNPETHRVDGFWQAWRFPRPWLFKALPGQWPSRGIHSGHAPLRPWRIGLCPPGMGIRHWGYVLKEHRLRKAEKYLDLA